MNKLVQIFAGISLLASFNATVFADPPRPTPFSICRGSEKVYVESTCFGKRLYSCVINRDQRIPIFTKLCKLEENCVRDYKYEGGRSKQIAYCTNFDTDSAK
mgnify:CR=1 FL=1